MPEARLVEVLGSPWTLNYLVATASGTLRDRIFCAENNDREPAEGFPTFNRRYEALIAEARALADDLRLPAAGYG